MEASVGVGEGLGEAMFWPFVLFGFIVFMAAGSLAVVSRAAAPLVHAQQAAERWVSLSGGAVDLCGFPGGEPQALATCLVTIPAPGTGEPLGMVLSCPVRGPEDCERVQ